MRERFKEPLLRGFFFFVFLFFLLLPLNRSGKMENLFSPLAALRRQMAPSSDPAAVKADLEKLDRWWRAIQSRIKELEVREALPESERQYLSQLREIALDAEDVLDEWSYELLRDKMEAGVAGAASKRKRGGEAPPPDQQAFRLLADDAPLRDRLATQIEGIVSRYSSLANEDRALRWGNGDGARRRGLPSTRPPTSSLVDELLVYDRKVYKDTLVKHILEECPKSQLSVIPIAGMGLVGKTTLAQLIYNDREVVEGFHLRGWVSLTRCFDLKVLLQRVVESLTSNPCRYGQLDAVQGALLRCLTRNKFLLVLDDVCPEHLYFWDQFKASLSSGSQGSVLLLTTKVGEVAKRTNTVPAPLYLFEGISNECCWLIFEKYAFNVRDTVEGLDMDGIHKRVEEICDGMPLVAKHLGISFCNRHDRDAWTWMLSMEDVIEDEILPALHSSFQLLPDYLKPCLLYCSLFPKGYMFKKGRLVRLWMAQGFILSKNQTCPEDIGIKYLDELISRSFFLPSETDEESYCVPNLICDLVDSISRGEHSRVVDMHNLPRKARHLSLALPECKPLIPCKSLYKFSSVRSLLVMQRFPYTPILNLEIQHELFLKLNLLRSLDLSYTSIQTLPDSIGNLKHLRFLALNHTVVEGLPETINKLYNLQTLELRRCMYLKKLSRGISSLVNLRHLDVEPDFVYKPLQIQKLTSLRKLPTFNLRKGNEFCGIRELQDLTNLRELGISGLCNVTSLDDARKANMHNKVHLKILELEWDSNDAITYPEQVGNCEGQKLLNSADEPDEEDENNDGDPTNARDSVVKQCSNHEEPSSCNVDDKPERQIADELDSNFSSIQLRRGLDNIGIQDSISSDSAISEELLNSLHPSTNLETLCIKSYGGIKFPDWVGDSSFSKLTHVRLEDCKCATLPPLGQLPFLKFLSIDGMPVQLVGTEFCGRGNANAFPKLETLSFHNLNKWENWNGVREGDFPNLKKLCLFSCPQLRKVPDLFSSLETLEVERCLKLTEIPNVSSLQILGLWCCDDLVALPTLTSLCSLIVMYCQKLKSLPPLPSLKNLCIDDCQKLTSLNICTLSLPVPPESADEQLLQNYRAEQSVNHSLHHHQDCGKITNLNSLHVSNCPPLCFSLKDMPDGIYYSSVGDCIILSKWDETDGEDNYLQFF
uniref:Putative disease resistance RPP13-like protein 1 n=1 Tax=Anthurium amnicola TaxID=1678845 RepID=A0A1D1YNH1_9ARAE